MTRTDIRNQVIKSLGDKVGAHDVDSIVNDIIATYGMVNIDAIDRSQYRDIVQRHDFDALTD
jgi:hypothetical protein